MSQQWKDATIKVLQTKTGWSVVIVVTSPSWGTPAKHLSESSRAAARTTVSGKASCRRNNVALDPNTRRST